MYYNGLIIPVIRLFSVKTIKNWLENGKATSGPNKTVLSLSPTAWAHVKSQELYILILIANKKPTDFAFTPKNVGPSITS